MRRLVIGLAVLLVLLFGVDRLAALAAQPGVAIAIQDSENLREQPMVRIGGFPLLTQALRGEYEDVEATLTGLPAEEGVTIDTLRVRLRGVQLPLSELVGGTVAELPVTSATATGSVGYDDLDAAAAARNTIPGLTVSFGPGEQGRLAVSGRYEGGLLPAVGIDGEADVEVQDGAIVVRPVADTLPALIRVPLTRLLGTSYQLPDLPLDFEAQEVRVRKTGVSLTATARDVVLK